MNGHEVGASGFVTQLRECLDEGHALDVTDRTSEFNYADVRLLVGAVDGNTGDALYPILDGIGDMRHTMSVSVIEH